MAKPETIGGMLYPTRAAIIKAVKEIIGRGGTLRLTGHDHDLIQWLWDRHPSKLTKTRKGRFFGFRVKNHTLYGVWESGACDFSYVRALAGKPGDPDIKVAARAAIESTISALFNVLLGEHKGCQVCSTTEALQVHHGEPWLFRDILAEFMDVAGAPVIVKSPTSVPGQSQHYFEEDYVRDAWIEFHNTRMIPQLVCEECHRELHREGGR